MVLVLLVASNDGIVADVLAEGKGAVVVSCIVVIEVVDAPDVVDWVGKVAMFVVTLVEERGEDGGVDGELLGDTFVGITVGVVGPEAKVLLLSGMAVVGVDEVVATGVDDVDDDEDNGELDVFMDGTSVVDCTTVILFGDVVDVA